VAEGTEWDTRPTAVWDRGRDELLALYRSGAPESARREGKAAVMARLRADYAALKAGPLGVNRA